MNEASGGRESLFKPEDYPIINALRKNARTSLKKMATKIGLPVSTVCDRMSRYQKSGVLRHTSLLDFRKAEYPVRHMVAIAAPNDKKKVLALLENHPNVNNLLAVSSGFDFLIETVFRDETEFAEFVRLLKSHYNIGITAMYSIVKDMKRESVELRLPQENKYAKN